MKLFGADKSDHPMADAKEARKIVDAIPGADSFKALEDLNHWLESVRTWPEFTHDHRADLVEMVDEAAQAHLRRLQRDYLSTSRLSKYQENRLWTTIRESYRQSAFAYATCVDVFVTSQKGWEVLKARMPMLTVRALHALAGQMKWQYIRYGLQDASLWGSICKIYAFAESRKYSGARIAVVTGMPEETSAELEFLKAVMLAVSSPDSLLPQEIELVERLVAHLAGSFKLTPVPQVDTAYGIDLTATQPPARIGRPPPPAPPLRFFSASAAVGQVKQLIQVVKSTNAVPSSVSLGGSYEPQMVVEVLEHLALNWSAQPPERKAPRHQVKSRVTITHGFDGVLSALDPGGEALFDPEKIESWIVENVSSGGFGALVPQLRGDWLKIGCLLGLQPEGGSNWIVGVVRRFQRDATQTGAVGIQTLGRTAQPAPARLVSGHAVVSRDTETAIMLGPIDAAPEAQLLLRTGVLAPGQNLQLEQDGKVYLLLPTGAMERGDDYEIVRCRVLRRDSGD